MTDRVNLPTFSLAERDRRYGAVRDEMAVRGLDCLVMPQNTGEWDACQPDARYLTGIGGGGTALAAVFPIEGDPIAIVREPRRTEFWKDAQDWVADVRATREGRWGDALVEAVGDLGWTRGRIGIVGLVDVLRFPDGTMTHREYVALRDAFPEATFESATGLMPRHPPGEKRRRDRHDRTRPALRRCDQRSGVRPRPTPA